MAELSVSKPIDVPRYEWSPAVYLLIAESWLLAVVLWAVFPQAGFLRYVIPFFALAPGCVAIRERASVRATYAWTGLLGAAVGLGGGALRLLVFHL
jgi:hypothetical protein